MLNDLDLTMVAMEIQQECHQSVEYCLNASAVKNISVQDATNAFIYRKLAEMELRLRILESKE